MEFKPKVGFCGCGVWSHDGNFVDRLKGSRECNGGMGGWLRVGHNQEMKAMQDTHMHMVGVPQILGICH